jgi:hypothetical protein
MEIDMEQGLVAALAILYLAALICVVRLWLRRERVAFNGAGVNSRKIYEHTDSQ